MNLKPLFSGRVLFLYDIIFRFAKWRTKSAHQSNRPHLWWRVNGNGDPSFRDGMSEIEFIVSIWFLLQNAADRQRHQPTKTEKKQRTNIFDVFCRREFFLFFSIEFHFSHFLSIFSYQQKSFLICQCDVDAEKWQKIKLKRCRVSYRIDEWQSINVLQQKYKWRLCVTARRSSHSTWKCQIWVFLACEKIDAFQQKWKCQRNTCMGGSVDRKYVCVAAKRPPCSRMSRRQIPGPNKQEK